MEEATGTWCGWCPGGIVALEYLKEKYDNSVFRIGVHSGDKMALSNYEQIMSSYISGYPSILFNRQKSYVPTDPANQIYSYIDNVCKEYLSYPSYATISLNASCSEDFSTLYVSTTTEFAINTDEQYTIAFAMVEDGVGPYVQTNYFYNSDISMEGWESKGTYVSWIYDDVSRLYVDSPDTDGCLPNHIEKDTPIIFGIELPIVCQKDEFRIIALLLNKESGEIINAAQLVIDKFGTGVESVVENSKRKFCVVNNRIETSYANGIKVFTPDGRRIANDNLAPGLYIVMLDNTSFKVYVR